MAAGKSAPTRSNIPGVSMDRRSFLKTGLALSAAGIAPVGFAAAGESPWRTFEVTTRVELQEGGPSRIWIPAPSVDTDYQKLVDTRYSSPNGTVQLVQDPVYGAGIVAAQFGGGVRPVLETTSRFATRDRAVSLDGPGSGAVLSDADRAKYLAPTE